MSLPLIYIPHLGNPLKSTAQSEISITTDHLREYRQTEFLGVTFVDPFTSTQFQWGPPQQPTTLSADDWLLEIFTQKYPVPTGEEYASYTDPLIAHRGHDPRWKSRYHDFDRILVEIGTFEKCEDNLRFELTDTSVPFDGTVNTAPPYHNRRYYGMHYTPRCYCYTNARKSWCGPVGPCGNIGNIEKKHEIMVNSLEQKRQHKRATIPKQSKRNPGRKGR